MIDLFAFVDTETSGLRRNDLPPNDPAQPHLLQIGCKLTDANRNVRRRFVTLIRPEGWSIEPEAQAIHGITEAMAHQAGVPCWAALAELGWSIENATQIVGHNLMGFDRPVIECAIEREGADGSWWRSKSKVMVDTMELATPRLKLSGQFGDFKWPSLEEAVRFFGRRGYPSTAQAKWIEWTSRHDAEDDVDATEFLFWALKA